MITKPFYPSVHLHVLKSIGNEILIPATNQEERLSSIEQNAAGSSGIHITVQWSGFGKVITLGMKIISFAEVRQYSQQLNEIEIVIYDALIDLDENSIVWGDKFDALVQFSDRIRQCGRRHKRVCIAHHDVRASRKTGGQIQVA